MFADKSHARERNPGIHKQHGQCFTDPEESLSNTDSVNLPAIYRPWLSGKPPTTVKRNRGVQQQQVCDKEIFPMNSLNTHVSNYQKNYHKWLSGKPAATVFKELVKRNPGVHQQQQHGQSFSDPEELFQFVLKDCCFHWLILTPDMAVQGMG